MVALDTPADGYADVRATGMSVMQAEQRFDRARLADIDRAIEAAVAARKLPGAVFRMERGGAVHERAYGRLGFEADAGAVTPDTIFDVASLTKVVATAPAVLVLAEEERIDLEAPLVRYVPECAGGGKDTITVRQLLTHTSGLASGLPAKPDWRGEAAGFALACAQEVTHPPGTFFRYSDINYILLGLLVRRVSGLTLDTFAQRRLFGPLGMRNTGFLPLARVRAGVIAPTGKGGIGRLHGDLAPGRLLQGVVHDPTVRRMGGVAGSAGVFSTASDIARFARMLLEGGELDGVRVLGRDSVRLLTTVQTAPGVKALRGMGMDIDSPYAKPPRGAVFPVGSYGHTGFTGCILWIDPGSHSFYVFLSNRVYPDDKSNILFLYSELGTLAARAAADSVR